MGLEGGSGAVSTPAAAQGRGLGVASPGAHHQRGIPVSVFSSLEGDGLGMDGASDWGVF